MNRAKLAEQNIKVPESDSYSFVKSERPHIGDAMHNGLDVKTESGSPVLTIINIVEENRSGSPLFGIELDFDHINPTTYSKVPLNDWA